MRKGELFLGLLLFAAAPAAAGPKLAVVIDDFGLTYPKNVPDEKWMAIPWRITFAVMPQSPRTRRAAAQTRERGHELIIHFPFDPFLNLDLAKGEEPTPGDVAKVTALLDDALRSIPGAVGLNNHRSYRATQNRALMRWFMGTYKAKKMYFLDSKVSPRSVAYQEARAAGIPALDNTVFLDEAKVHDKAFCMKMLRRAAAYARKHGSAIAIGHHYFHGTYEGLVELVPQLQAEGIEFVHASELLK